MFPFRATAFNEKGYTFLFHFKNENWNDVDLVARKQLDEIVANDRLHQMNGPWNVRNIDVGY